MTHEAIPIESKNAGRVHILTGTVTGIGSNTVDVDIDDYGIVLSIPVFYHCPGVETADGDPFSIGNRVIIVNSGDTLNPVIANMKVIGFEDGLPRECPPYEFYIRPTFNGFTPMLGGEKIKLENDEFNERKITTVVGDFAGLCGPFTKRMNTGNEYIFLEAGNYFKHYVEVPSEDASSHLGYSFSPYPRDPSLTFFQFGGVPPEDAILHVNQVDWLRYGSILSGCPKTTETIDGKEYTIYQVDFVNLYTLTKTETTKKLAVGLHCAKCRPIPIDPSINVFTGLGIAQDMISARRFWVGRIACWHLYPVWPWGTYRTQQYDYYYNHTPEFGVSKNNLCILSNEFGQNPVYSKLTIDTNLYIKSSTIEIRSGDLYQVLEEVVCLITDTDYPGYSRYEYEMVLTPEDKF